MMLRDNHQVRASTLPFSLKINNFIEHQKKVKFTMVS